jgi:hypothetical protein
MYVPLKQPHFSPQTTPHPVAVCCGQCDEVPRGGLAVILQQQRQRRQPYRHLRWWYTHVCVREWSNASGASPTATCDGGTHTCV